MTRFTLLYAQRWRRDVVQLTLWIAGTVALAALGYLGVHETFGTAQDRTTLVSTAIANPVIMLFRGLPSGTDEGAVIAFLLLPYTALLATFMSTFLAVRHTRGDEELGRAELVAATPAGRMLPLAATIVHGLLANIVLAALIAACYPAVGLGGAGGPLIGAATGATGVAFFGIALVVAQLVGSARAANSAAVWIVLLAFLLSGVGNALGTSNAAVDRIDSAWPAWLSPIGWAEHTRPFDLDDPRPLLLSAAAGAVGIVLAIVLQNARDLGASLVPDRGGRAHATALLAGPIGLVWRLSWGALVGWAVGGFLTGVLSTRLADLISQISEQIPAVAQIATAMSQQGSLAQGAIAIFFVLGGVLAACAAVQTVSHARQEEAAGRAEPVLSAPVGRVRWLAGYLVVAALAIVVTLAATVVGAFAGLASLSDPDWTLGRDILVSGGGQALAAAVFLVLTAFVFVVAPRLTIAIGWTAVAVATVLGLFGSLFGFPEALVNLSPVAVAPTIGGDDVDIRGLWWLVLAVVVGAAASLALMRRRELAADG
jgi:ABC-2 type transport system permease protein